MEIHSYLSKQQLRRPEQERMSLFTSLISKSVRLSYVCYYVHHGSHNYDGTRSENIKVTMTAKT